MVSMVSTTQSQHKFDKDVLFAVLGHKANFLCDDSGRQSRLYLWHGLWCRETNSFSCKVGWGLR